ncbi:MAG: TraB/GumN family protein [Phenylobacterium sp.]|uniref:TraB/GumN family protein n=1 Tax=Phenylobacterium sp. TaxID=1871053 RepID=UPI00391A4367
MGWLRSAAGAAVFLLASLCGAAASAAPALWVARDADTEIYLFGTLHLLTPDAAWRTPAYDAAYERAQTVWFEADLARADSATMGDLMGRYGVDPARPLSVRLPPQELAALQPALARGGLDLAGVDHLRPWAAALTLSIRPKVTQGYRADAGADLVVARQARAGEKEIRTLETLEDQIRIFADLPEPVELQYLADVVRELTAPPRRGGVSLQQAWLAGDVRALDRGILSVLRRDTPEFHEAFIRRRNLAWAETLDGVLLAPGGVHLVNVGALHMAGEDGLPALLRARGYRVERVQ